MYEHGTRSRYRKFNCRCDLCTKANSDYLREYRLAHIEQERENKRRWRAENHEQHRANDRRWKRDNPWRNHHLTNAGYAALLESQGGCCANCRITVEEYGRSLDVDHDHACCPGTYSCGKCIRALLCRSCNLKLRYSEGA